MASQPEMTGGQLEAEQLRAIRTEPLAKRIPLYLKLMGPAFMVTALFIGGATIVTASTLGFLYGTKWLWVAVVGVIAYGAVLVALAKFTVYSGKDFLTSIKDDLHPVLFYIAIISVLIPNTIFHVTQVFLSASIFEAVFGIQLLWGVLLTIAIVGFIVLGGRARQFVKVIGWTMQSMVWLLFVIFLLTFVLIPVDWGEIASGLVPTFEVGGQEAIAVGAFVASTLGVQTFFLGTMSIKERAWTNDHEPLWNLEAALNVILFFLVNFLLITIFTFTLGREGIEPVGVVQPAQAIEPFAGEFATAIFLLGVWVAVISSIAMQVAINGQAAHLLFPEKIPLNMSDWRFKVAAATIFVFGFLVPGLGMSPFPFLVYAVSFNAPFTPLLALLLLYLVNKTDLVGDGTPGTVLNVLLALALVVTLIGAAASLIGQFG